MDGAGKTGAEEAQPPKGKGEQEQSRQEEEVAEAPQGLFRGGKSGPLEQEEEERLSEEWEDAKRWSKMDQLANELTAEKRLDREDEDDPDRSMKLSFRDQGYGFRGPGMQLRRGWRPSSREDSVEAGLPLQARGYPEEKKEEEGSANRRPEVGTEQEPAPGVLAQLGEEGQLHSDVWPCPTGRTQSPWSLGLERHSDRGLFEAPQRPGLGAELGRGRRKGISGRAGSEPQLKEGTQSSWRAGRQETGSVQISAWKQERW